MMAARVSTVMQVLGVRAERCRHVREGQGADELDRGLIF